MTPDPTFYSYLCAPQIFFNRTKEVTTSLCLLFQTRRFP